MKIGLLCSGELGFEVLRNLKYIYPLAFVAADSNSQKVILYCKENKLSCFKGNPRKGKLHSFLNNVEFDILISVNYMFIIEENTIQLAKKIAFNIHGSLLPKYRGRTPHVWAIINGENKCGITAHIIDASCDTGDILCQLELPIFPIDTGATILEKYKKNYLFIIYQVLDELKNGTLKKIKQDNDLATYFAKRTPEDGQINWDWHSERICNWVRAQSNPYPGAFSYINGQKLIIDWVEPTDLGFDYLEENGTVVNIKDNFLYVKCPNKVLKLERIRNLCQIDFKDNMVLK